MPKTKIRIASAIGTAMKNSPILQVVGEDRVEVVLDRRLAGDVGLGARDRPGRLAHLVGVALRVGRLEAGDDASR